MRVPFLLPLLAILAAFAPAHAADLTIHGTTIAPGVTKAVSWTFQGRARGARIHVPSGYSGAALPLVVVLHGGGGTAAAIEASSGWSATADAAGWLVAYPQGLSLDAAGSDDPAGELAYWANDRGTRPDLFGIDDVGFVTGLVTDLATAAPLDSARVYAMGMSNGGMMVHRLGRDSARTWAALCAVSGSYTATPSVTPFAPANPVAMLLIHGTSDTIVPYAGGAVDGQGGPVIGVEAGRDLWLQADGITGVATVSDLPDTVADGCTSQRLDYPVGAAGTRVALIRVDGGNHSWPGGSGSTGAGAGNKTDDFSATTTARTFFAGQHQEPEIALLRDGAEQPTGGGVTVDGLMVGHESMLTWTVANHGAATLTCGALTISTGNCSVGVVTSPGPIPPGGSMAITLRVTPSAPAWNISASLVSDDGDEPAYAWTADGTAGVAGGSGGSTGDDGGSGGGGCGAGAAALVLALGLLLAGRRR